VDWVKTVADTQQIGGRLKNFVPKNLDSVKRFEGGQMNRWRQIALVQRICGAIPRGDIPYHWIQRSIGAHRRGIDMVPYLKLAAEINHRLRDQSLEISGARVLEVGTGYGLGMPLAFYLCGAERIYTFDLHRYLNPKLLMRAVQSLTANAVEEALADVVNVRQLRNRLISIRQCKHVGELLKATRIEYRAPADAARTGLPEESIDIHFSLNVLEHISRSVIERILLEAQRVLSPGGTAFHRINPGDHFGRYDRSITTINFLQFSEPVWRKIAGNQFAYHNRLRAPQYRETLDQCGQELLWWQQTSDERARKALASGFVVDSAFRNYSTEDLSVHTLDAMFRPRKATHANEGGLVNDAYISQ
jgi:ubiquinone/menaquinone biosynthesis C-methylase UbiE